MIIPIEVKRLMQTLLDKDFKVYVVGGAVRDYYMGIIPHDYDLFTDATGEQILSLFPQGHVLGGEERQAKILTVIVDGVEISQFRSNGDRTETGKDLKNHCSTCDFSINSVACTIDGEIIDYYNGIVDIGRKRLRFVGNPEDRIREDPLRLFRGIRFIAKYNLQVETPIYFHKHIDYIQGLPKERVRDEFLKILLLDGGPEWLELFGVLGTVLPAWNKVKYLDGGHHHAEIVGAHMNNALRIAKTLTNKPLLLLAIYLHDIGKGEAHAIGEDGTITFYEHHTIGSDIVAKWMKEYKFSDSEIKYVATMVRHHMMGKTGNISQNTFIKICNDLNNAGVTPEDMLTLTYSDNQANQKNPKLYYSEFITNNGYLQRYYEVKYNQRAFNPNDLGIGGLTIAKVLGVEPGPIIGKAKEYLFDAVCKAEVLNREDKLIMYLIEHKEELQ